MPYASTKEVPDYVPAAKKKQWLEVWNSAYERETEKGQSKEDAEASAFRQANAVAGPNSEKVLKGEKFSQESVGYEELSTRIGETCGPLRGYAGCVHFEPPDSCEGVAGPIAATGYCLRFDPDGRGVGNKAAFAGRKAMSGKYQKFVPFAKVDAAKREVWGIVTAEVPDKDDEVCDYFKSKPYYEEVIAEMSKAAAVNPAGGDNFMPLREMHDLSAVGKGIGYELRDPDREIFFGFKVVDDDAWKKVEENVYTGFSHGGVKIGDMVPDPVFKGCMRYVAKPSEVSLVDNPCLGIAHFTYVSKTGVAELRKNRSVVDSSTRELRKGLEALQSQFDTFRKSADGKPAPVATITSTLTKRVAGEDLMASCFLLVEDPRRPETWQLPIKFSTPEKSKFFVRASLVSLDRVKVPEKLKGTGYRKRLELAVVEHGLSAEDEKGRFAAIADYLRKGLRKRVNRLTRAKGDVGHSLTWVDDDLGRLAKGMYEVGCLAQHVNCLTGLLYNVISEQAWEKDDTSALPSMLHDSVDGLLDALVEMVAEESRELREELARRV
jgi:hypothetical protein